MSDEVREKIDTAFDSLKLPPGSLRTRLLVTLALDGAFNRIAELEAAQQKGQDGSDLRAIVARHADCAEFAHAGRYGCVDEILREIEALPAGSADSRRLDESLWKRGVQMQLHLYKILDRAYDSKHNTEAFRVDHGDTLRELVEWALSQPIDAAMREPTR